MSHQGHVHKGGCCDEVGERRLRPIYDALDDDLNQKAVNLANQLLKKDPSVWVAKVLKGLALCRLQNVAEGRMIIDEIKSAYDSKPITVDDQALRAWMALCHDASHHEALCWLMEKLTKANPGNEEITSQYFMSLVRCGRTIDQAAVARDMYKKFGKTPYLFWSIMSTVMQALKGDRGVKDADMVPMLLLLAEKALEKSITDGKFAAAEAMRLFLLVLNIQGKHDRAIQLLIADKGGAYGSKPLLHLDSERHVLLIELCAKTNRWQEVKEMAVSAIKDNGEEWSNYVYYLDSIFHDPSTGASLYGEGEAFFNSLLQSSDAKIHRSANLGLVELFKRSGNIPQMVGNIITHVRMFGDLGCCIGDLLPYLPLAVSMDKQILEAAAHAIPTEANYSDDRYVQRHLTYLQLSRLFASQQPSKEQALESIDALLKAKKASLPRASSRISSEVLVSDAYALMAAHQLLELYHATKERTHLFRAIIELTEAVSHSPSNAQLKLLLFRTHIIAGSLCVGLRYWSELDVKQISFDTIGHMASDHLLLLGYIDDAQLLAARSLKFFSDSVKEIPDFVLRSFKNGSFGKILELNDLQKKFEHSYQWMSQLYQTIVISLLRRHNSLAGLRDSFKEEAWFNVPSDASIDELYDNSDCSVMDFWAELTKLKEFESRRTSLLARKKTLLKLRFAVLKALDCIVSKDGLGLDAFILALESVDLASLVEEHGTSGMPAPFTHGINMHRDFDGNQLVEGAFFPTILLAFKATAILNNARQAKSITEASLNEEIAPLLSKLVAALTVSAEVVASAPMTFATLDSVILERIAVFSQISIVVCACIRVWQEWFLAGPNAEQLRQDTKKTVRQRAALVRACINNSMKAVSDVFERTTSFLTQSLTKFSKVFEDDISELTELIATSTAKDTIIDSAKCWAVSIKNFEVIFKGISCAPHD